jgi:hypothetical protein
MRATWGVGREPRAYFTYHGIRIQLPHNKVDIGLGSVRVPAVDTLDLTAY